MKKVAILTPFDTGNFGTVLQAYSTQKMIEERGCKADIIYFHYDSIQNPFLISNLFKRGIKKYIASMAGFFLRLPSKRLLWDFINQNLHLTKKVSHDELGELSKDYDLVLVGSDCVWNGDAFSLETAYLLDFLDDNEKKVNYASSFACDDISDEQIPIFRKYLKDFKSLSVREVRGRELINKIVGREATVVLDPTLAKDREFWFAEAKKSKLNIQEKYIFVAEYAISAALLHDAEKLSQKYGLPIYFLYPPKGKRVKGKVFFSAAPQDVVYLIQNAEMVLTDSYHMMIFSINYGKEFFAYRTPTNIPAISKYNSILQILEIKNRLFETEKTNVNPVDVNSLEPIDYDSVNKLLAREREKSMAYLDSILQGEVFK